MLPEDGQLAVTILIQSRIHNKTAVGPAELETGLKLLAIFSRATTFLALAASLGCTAGPELRVNADPAADFSGYRTFGFVRPLGTDNARGPTMMSARLSAATTRELEARGLRFVSNNPDLLVNFFTGFQSGIQMTNMPIFVMPVPNYGAWTGYRATFQPGERITEGTLGVHLVDRRSNRLVWEGIANERVTEAMGDNPDETINTLIEAIFAEFP
jgi:hypothetical protein